MAEPFEKKSYLTLTLDPVHVGTGGYRLGHVDNTILRECGTRMPKVPGSSLNGVLRAYTAMAVQADAESDGKAAVFREEKDGLWKLNCDIYGKSKYLRPKYVRVEEENEDKEVATLCEGADGRPLIEVDPKTGQQVFLSCAGKGGAQGDGHCCRPDCPVCVAFGFSKGDEGGFQGLVQFFDMHVLLFPVYSSIGPVWVTAPGALRAVDISIRPPESGRFGAWDGIADERIFIGGYEFVKEDAPRTREAKILDNKLESIPGEIKNRVLVFDDVAFGRIVNDNLEVRTSVSINPETGAAEDGALFTYEAIPRATVMVFDVVYNRPEFFRIGGQEIAFSLEDIRKEIARGMVLLESLGIGGMNTRGFGRIRVLNTAFDANGQEKNNES